MTGWSSGNTAENGQTGQDQPVVHFTEAARGKILELIEARGLTGRAALRIVVKNPGFGVPEYGMALEESGDPRPDDTVIDADGLKVLVDARSLPAVNGATVDFYDQVLQRGFKIEPPPPPPPAPRPKLDLSDPVVAAVQAVIDQQINPGIASHGGRATLVDVKDGVVYVELGGGCQGCSMVSVTLKQGIERLIKHQVPAIREVIDVTDHAGGRNPYFTQAKGASPFQTASKG